MKHFILFSILVLAEHQRFVSCQNILQNIFNSGNSGSFQGIFDKIIEEATGADDQNVRVAGKIVESLLGTCPPLVGKQPPFGCTKTFVEDVNGNFPCRDDLDCPDNKQWWIDEGCNNINGNGMTYGTCDDSGTCNYYGNAATCQWKDGNWEVENQPTCTDDPSGQWICYSAVDVEGCSNQAFYWVCQPSAVPQIQNNPDCGPRMSCASAGGAPPEYVSPSAGVGVRSSCQYCQELNTCPPNKPCKTQDGRCSRARCGRRKCWCPKY